MSENENNDRTANNRENYLELLKYVCTILATIVISMMGFWLTIGKEYISRSEAKEIASEQVTVIAFKLDMYLEEEKKIKIVIEKNTEAINALKNQMSLLEVSLQAIQRDRNNNVSK